MKVQVIVGSTRPGRVSDRIAKWVVNHANQLDGVDAELVDLKDYDLPMLDEPISPQYNPERQPNDEAKRWLDKLGEADGYVLVTPEYNRSYPAVLKNALDYVDFQLKRKPVALVAHGSTGGAQAVAHLRGVIPGLQSFTVPSATFLVGRAGLMFDEDGNLDKSVQGPQVALENTLDELTWYAEALASARVSQE
ncbi:MAG TPA: NAD(P)H-dependent oxidoreductase [Candidatus Saccharimonadales bacterium]|nr:NAD(P)H-dependent oxidoreductase [Candidatus Saccharimonadales bacterium]